ncbi:hypothetical protein Palpr_0714 [Paludibacter propionicigenes WB4]|uniref:Uncharacterized protein n=1 Tax=Paludibacter propionicigenes (strain DSM 17365 / JCM 13257 / WB4) TaxID=694427 RepID=E4T2C6_PALPW|nr:hypothetical protein [Paludibacter propionicigenes]ADQ78870.1 hypothetical protein Palpr_0714 [Paludibacter propionicigenes WB4]
MLNKINIILTLICLFWNAQRAFPLVEIESTTLDSTLKINDTKASADSIIRVEYFVDSVNIGQKHKNKIEITNYQVKDSNYVVINFYSLLENRLWRLKQTFNFEKDGLTSCDPLISDFNNDNFNDFTYISAIAARMSNEVRRLFIYDNSKDELILIKNSEDYPNMLYNKQLDCIDAFLIHGGTSTIFLKIIGDSLNEFASVHNSDYRVIYKTDKAGNRTLIRKKKINDEGIWVRYKNYDPLEAYKEKN